MALLGGEPRQVNLFRIINGVAVHIASKRAKTTDTQITYKKQPYLFDATKPAYKHGRTVMYAIDMDTGMPLVLASGSTDFIIDKEYVDQVCLRHVAKDIVVTSAGPARLSANGIIIYIVIALASVFGGLIMEHSLHILGA